MAWYVMLVFLWSLAPGWSHAATGDCSETRKFFDHHEITYGRSFRDRASSVCDAASCCSARDDSSLMSLARHTLSADLRLVLSSSLYTLERVSRRLDGSICNSLWFAREESNRILQQTYKVYYARNKVIFTDFFANVAFAGSRSDCCHCNEEIEEVVYSFLRNLVLVALKEQSGTLMISEKYEKCVHKWLIEARLISIFTQNRITWLLTRVRRQVCLPCKVKQTLRASHYLVHRAVTEHVANEQCLEGLRCMQSCGCCSNATGCLETKPCFSCCKQAIGQCVNNGGIAAADRSFSDIVSRVASSGRELREGKADDVLRTIGILLSELIMEIYRKTEETRETVSQSCGFISDHAMTVGFTKAPLGFPSCIANVSKMSIALEEVEESADMLGRTFRNIDHNVCLNKAGGADSGCDGCTGCQFGSRSTSQSASTNELLMAFIKKLPREFRPLSSVMPQGLVMPPITCQTPRKFADRTGPPTWTKTPLPGATGAPGQGGIVCDDEDNDCCGDGSGDGSGSGASGNCQRSGSGAGVDIDFSGGGDIDFSTREEPDKETEPPTTPQRRRPPPGPITRPREPDTEPSLTTSPVGGTKQPRSSAKPSARLHTLLHLVAAGLLILGQLA